MMSHMTAQCSLTKKQVYVSFKAAYTKSIMAKVVPNFGVWPCGAMEQEVGIRKEEWQRAHKKIILQPNKHYITSLHVILCKRYNVFGWVTSNVNITFNIRTVLFQHFGIWKDSLSNETIILTLTLAGQG